MQSLSFDLGYRCRAHLLVCRATFFCHMWVVNGLRESGKQHVQCHQQVCYRSLRWILQSFKTRQFMPPNLHRQITGKKAPLCSKFSSRNSVTKRLFKHLLWNKLNHCRKLDRPYILPFPRPRWCEIHVFALRPFPGQLECVSDSFPFAYLDLSLAVLVRLSRVTAEAMTLSWEGRVS